MSEKVQTASGVESNDAQNALDRAADVARVASERAKGELTFAKAVSYYNAGAFDEALPLFEEARLTVPVASPRRRNCFYYMIQIVGFQRRDFVRALALCNQATDESPDHVDAWFLKGRALAELKKPLSAFKAFRRAWSLKQQPRTAYEFTKIFDQAGRYRLASRMGRLACELGADNPNLLTILAKDLTFVGEHLPALEVLERLEKAGHNSSYIAFLRSLAEGGAQAAAYLLAHPGGAAVRHIAIGGENYVGSTLFGILLGSLPGVSFAGETQQITHRWDVASERMVAIDFDRDLPGQYSHCRACGPECKVIDQGFRESLNREPLDLYAKIGRRLGSPVLVSSDKAMTRLAAMDPLFAFDLIILFKPPGSWIRSYAKERARFVRVGLITAETAGTPQQWLDQWCNTNEDLLRMPIRSGGRIVLNWERFVADPAFHFERLLKKLGLEGDSSVFENLELGHFFGGNETGNLPEVLETRRVTFRPSTAPALDPVLAREVEGHARSKALAQRLDRLYEVEFGKTRDAGDFGKGRIRNPSEGEDAPYAPS